MNKDAKATIQATFEANPNDKVFYANSAGHCFRTPGEGLVQVTRESLLEKNKGAEGGEDSSSMTVAQLKEALKEANIEFNPKATKAELVELLEASKNKSSENEGE